MVLWVDIRVFSGCLFLITGIYNVKAWTYHYNIDTNMDWTKAREWCQKNFTDMVAIQNQEEIAYLNQILPFHSSYYWIGIRKIDGHWMWVGTKKHLVPEAANWARNEPNNRGTGEDCVEIYIRRQKDTAKWNDERCNKKKAALCYLASCSDKSCSEHAECVETIGSYECQCDPGFRGPRCEEVVQCWPVKNPQQGFVKCEGIYGAFHFNSSCQFQCDTGFKLEGEQRLRCLASEHWDNALPVCRAVQCLPIIDAPGGWSMNCTHPLSNNSYNSSCEFKCEEGFELQGSDTTWCDHTGHWTHKPPTCTVVTCNPVLAPAKSHLTCADIFGKFSFRSSCNVSCDEGYKLRGKATLNCLSDGNWSAATPACEVVKCDPLKPSPHGSLQCSDPVEEFAYGSTCWVKCDFGFVLNGTNSTNCTAHGNWSHTPPVCHAIQCPPFSNAPSFGSMSCTHPLSNNSYNSSCEFKCEEGFELQGSDTTWCDHTGHWTHKPPTCTVVTCNPVLAPAKSHLTCADIFGKFSFRSSCNVSCDEGYKLRGKATLNCLSDGNWSVATPACEVVKCDPLKPSPHGSLQCSDPVEEFAYGSTCWVKCDFGFVHNGTNSTNCTAHGNWSHIPPVCHAIQCPPFSNAPSFGSMSCTHPLSNNSYNSSCEFKCEEGFVLKGADSTLCDHTGHWTHSTPTCAAVACDPLVVPAQSHLTCADPLGKFSFRSSCNATCEEGYRLRGEPTLTCLSDGNWSAPTPECEVIRCDALESFQHGTVQCQDRLEKFSYGSLCWLECGAGFTLNGSNSTYCTSQGKWSQDLPVCQAQQCSPVIDPSHGTVTCTHPHGQFSFGTVCEVSCKEGFKLHGTPRMECLEMGKWTDTPPFCLAQQCPLLTAQENGWMNCSHPHSLFSYGSQCFLGCEAGFEIKGQPGMECSASGNWSQEMPSCTAVRCAPLSFSQLPELEPPPSMNCSHPHGNFSFGSQCFFQCAKDHELNGTSQLICTSKGYWTNSPPSCVVKEMSMSAGMLTYTAVGVASSAGILLLGGLMYLLMRQFTKKAAHYSLNDDQWKGDLNPAFEFN
ncbi:P-selectin isoform X1 [Megalobrama amblycephala]|uniref:P-selectin isoform X1 n=1 Tax=Megalobrama amblycephala TaxID=75352 RepID=UPI002013D5C5|nr:P-selectin isoform X1 [Megalobrama amblycephala]